MSGSKNKIFLDHAFDFHKDGKIIHVVKGGYMRNTITSLMVACSIVFVFCSGCSSFMKSDNYYGVKTASKNIVFLIDISGSMEGKNEGNVTDRLRAQALERAGSSVGSMIGGRMGSFVSSSIRKESTKLASAKRELKPAIMGLDEHTRFTVLTFSDNVDAWNDTLQTATGTSRASGYAFIQGLEANGGTSALRGLKHAFTIQGVDTIFFLSDGYPSDASSSRILKEVQKLNRSRNVVIHAIGLGDNKDEAFMRALAAENGGKYVEG